MTIGARIQNRQHTSNRFRLAAHQRRREAEVLFLAKERAGSIYLFGYVAEALLKAAFIRLRPHTRPSTPIPFHLLKSEYRSAYNLYRPPAWHGTLDLHSLNDLLDALSRKRRSLGRPYPVLLESRLRSWVRIISRQHKVEMRYYPVRPSTQEMAEVRGAIRELIDHYRDL